jgi:RimJ/RimL family protein N-acetyltransferase
VRVWTWGFASLDILYLTAMINPKNEASIRLAHRLGMSPLREDVLLGDRVVVYSVDREDWARTSQTAK